MNKKDDIKVIEANCLDGANDARRVEVLAEFVEGCVAVGRGEASDDESYLVTVQAASLLCALLDRAPMNGEHARVLAPLASLSECVTH